MRVLVSGSSGLVGSALVPRLENSGHEVHRLVRPASEANEGDIIWVPSDGDIDRRGIEGFDAVIHLAGENIAATRWTADQKQRILRSRVQGTTLLSGALAQLAKKPQVLVSASAVGYYGDAADALLDERSASGEGFLPDVCRQWEAATQAAQRAGIRVVHARFGVILSPHGGALAKMLPPFRLGLGGIIGTGQQYVSWVAMPDAVGAIEHCLATPQIRGPVNVVSPNPVTNHEWTKTLGKILSRPTLFPLPASFARFVFGEMADELLLSSQRVLPKVLQQTGYEFQYPDLEGALRWAVGSRIKRRGS